MSKIVCIGSGNMGSALMNSASKTISVENIFFADADMKKAQSAASSIGAEVCNSNIEAAEKGDLIFLAVKPQVMAQVLAEIAPAARKRKRAGDPPVFVSMAAGWSIEKIQRQTAVRFEQEIISTEHLPVVRIMPNTPALIGNGMIALCASPEVPPEKLAEIEKVLCAAGIVDRISEKDMDAVTGLSGSGPAFVYLFIEALADGGVRAGLPRNKAVRYAVQTVLGAAAMVQETGIHPGELKDMVTSPGGTTIAGIAALENGAFRGTVINAVEAAWRRAIELNQ